MPKYTVKELREAFADDDQNDTVIAVTWQRSDFPRVWDKLVAAFNNQWDDDLVNATAGCIQAHCSDLGINLRDEEDGDA
jgi:hypothetical protein